MNDTTQNHCDFNQALRDELAELTLTEMPLLSIAIWGWQGDGKTTSLLTAVHFADAMDHVLSFAPVREHDEIAEIAKRPELKEIPLLLLAKSSAAKIESLMLRFIDENKWPDGTDAGDAYLLRVEDKSSTKAFAIITDLPGGSYSEHDRVAEEVILNSHALMIMVAPERWQASGLSARAYQNMVRYRIRRSTELKVPVSVMIAQADKDPESAQSVKDKLQIFLNELNAENGCELFVVSVIGDPNSITLPDSGPDDLPNAVERNPSALIEAWSWTMVKALRIESILPRKHKPIIELEQTAKASTNQLESLLELRQVGDFSSLSGTLLCPISNTGSECSYLLLQKDGKLIEVSLNSEGGLPKLSSLGILEDAENLLAGNTAFESAPSSDEAEPDEVNDPIATGIYASIFDGELIVAHRSNTSVIWKGHLHDLVRPLAVPNSLAAWQALSSDRIAGLDKEGRLHLYRSKSGQWGEEEFIADFFPNSESPPYLCYIEHSKILVAGDSASAEAVRVGDTGFGDRISAPLNPQYDIDGKFIASSKAGSLAYLDSEQKLSFESDRCQVDLSEHSFESVPMVALGSMSAELIAWIDPDLRLRVGSVTEDGERVSSDNLSPLLTKNPKTIKWATGDKLLAVDLGDDTWSLYKVFGL